MLLEIEKLLYQRYILHTKKFELIRELHPQSYMRSAKTLNKIHIILTREIIVNKKLIRLLRQSSFPQDIQKSFVEPICFRLKEITKVLVQENKVLCQTNIFSLGYSYAQKLFTGKQEYFQKYIRTFHSLAEKELLLHQQIFELSHKLPQSYSVDEQKVRRSWKLVIQLQEELHALAKSVGDTALVKKHGDRVLVLIFQIQKTEIYEFVKQDVGFIKVRVEYIMAHPKEHKLAYFLTTVYIVAPFTFEMTGVILFFRYLGKYTVSRTRKFKTRFTKKASLR
ncbi:MAG: hypothetical protein Q8R18_02360 [bacterium]|nr:hypothetical protein [bacterium]